MGTPRAGRLGTRCWLDGLERMDISRTVEEPNRDAFDKKVLNGSSFGHLFPNWFWNISIMLCAV